MWRTIQADGCEWEVRAVAAEHEPQRQREDEVLEFRSRDGLRPPRRVLVGGGTLDRMSADELLAVYRRARPIGADYYGRPGKRMPDGIG